MHHRVTAGVLGIAAAILGTGAASAHPHVFAEAKIEIVGTPDGQLAAIRNIWRMDELFSSSVIVDFDKNANGTLDDDELAEVGATVKESIAEWNFYTFVEAGGRDVIMAPPDEILMLWENNQLLMFFEMKAGEPVDLAKDKLTVSNFDETFFVAFDFASEGDFQLVDMPKICVKKFLVPDEDEAAKQWLASVATLAPDETIPDDGVNYSKVLAARLEVTCAPAS